MIGKRVSQWSPQPATPRFGTPTPTRNFPNTLVEDEAHYDKTPVGKGSHVLHRKVQPTEWSRKAGIVGRDISDIKAWELSHRGLSDFCFWLLSEGRHQSVVWARSGSESALTTNARKQHIH